MFVQGGGGVDEGIGGGSERPGSGLALGQP